MPKVFPSPALQYEPFLYAVVCDETNGMQLTLVSAIARTGVDPWGEAARIAHLPRPRAREVLTALIPRRPGLGDERPDAQAIADRLMALLPRRGARYGAESGSVPEAEIVAESPAEAPSSGVSRPYSSQAVLAVLAVCLGLALVMVIFARSHPETSDGGAAPAGQSDRAGK